MNAALINIVLGFAEGFALILSPCILTILPIILANSLTGSKSRSVGIILGFVFSFALVAFFARDVVQYSGIDLDLMRYIAYGILVLLGLVLLSNTLTGKFNQFLQRLIAALPDFFSSYRSEKGFVSGLLMGGVVAMVWTPCAGPILAAVLVQIAIQKTSLASFFTLLAFTLGAAIPMFIIAMYGLKVRDSLTFFKQHAVFFRKTLGAIIIINLAYIYYQETGLTPVSTKTSSIRTAMYLEKGLWRPYKAPEIAGIDTWLNSQPLHLSDLKGNVVLIDFWTYSCINCIRTLPYLKEWYKKYHKQGLVIIGVHAPEFDFEKSVPNVTEAVHRNGIDYPVALDNKFETWGNFSNHYWPAQYLINKQGQVVYEHFGEGDDDVTENNIRFLLGVDKPMPPSKQRQATFSYAETPETYLGYARADFSLSPSLTKDSIADYQFPSVLNNDAWGLQGGWRVDPDKIVAANANAAIKLHFNARHVYIVMGTSTQKPISVKVLLNGKPVGHLKGSSVVDGAIRVDKHTIYEALNLPQLGNGTLELITERPGLELYTFTFGG